ncbi:hypothetical protein LTR22_021171 [Elasticomyces elasticus]|nr:hypothetical protein LTR22_021171 [Elasticomyces elasticus]KAK4909326.1 hypothetical protein LTR49_021917 [Elasticomyces elasticus]KAK5749881.1 hypothetical protein LTS12_020027 [Elasticomyces elasticus]
MAPSAVDVLPEAEVIESGNRLETKATADGSTFREPLKYSGSLDEYESFDVTNVIGKEFPALQLSQILSDDTKIRDLAITGTTTRYLQTCMADVDSHPVSQRGVVFFRNQDLTIDDQKLLGQKLGELTGKPKTSKLHKHALLNSKRGLSVDENGRVDDEISIISSEQNRRLYEDRYKVASKHLASEGWHADITFERVPSDYAILKIVQPPEDAGGDTLWASGYEAYDRLSPAFKKLAESLTATHYQPEFNRTAAKYGIELIDDERGAPENKGLDFQATHPVVRTNPVTGWKSLFGAGGQVKNGWIDDVSPRESEVLKEYFLQVVTSNHDLQVRFKWGKDDLAVWDNRSVFHTATNDYYGSRQGNRVVSLGEKPYFDPSSVSRREAQAKS